jgi:hypothetical protein
MGFGGLWATWPVPVRAASSISRRRRARASCTPPSSHRFTHSRSTLRRTPAGGRNSKASRTSYHRRVERRCGPDPSEGIGSQAGRPPGVASLLARNAHGICVTMTWDGARTACYKAVQVVPAIHQHTAPRARLRAPSPGSSHQRTTTALHWSYICGMCLQRLERQHSTQPDAT